MEPKAGEAAIDDRAQAGLNEIRCEHRPRSRQRSYEQADEVKFTS